MAPNGNDRRSEQRREYTQWVECILLDGSSGEPLFHFQSPAHDLSPSGVGLYIASPTSLCMPMLVQLRKSASDPGEVRYGTIASVEPRGHWFALGIKFENEIPEQFRDIDFRQLATRIAA